PPPKELAEALAAMNGSARNYAYSNPPDPGEDAPIKVLIAYWDMQAGEESGKQPSEKVRQRLLQASEEEPDFSLRLLDFLPDTPVTDAKLRRILDDVKDGEDLREKLISEAGSVRDDRGNVKGSRQLAALARLDWRTAEPLLKNYAGGAAPRTAAFALGLLYEHAAQNNQLAEANTIRDRLSRIVIDPQAPGASRALAVEALMKTDWQGRDEWFLSLFADHTLQEMKDGYGSINALAEPVRRDPDRWIPMISKLIGHSDRNIHNAAALCLAQFVDHRARRDALSPLLPWLSDPQWAVTSDNYARARLVDSMGQLKMHEALPGLVSILGKENGYIRSSAIKTLEIMGDKSVVPILREAIRAEKKNDGEDTSSLIRALIGLGG